MLAVDRTRGRRLADLRPRLEVVTGPQMEPLDIADLKRQCNVIDAGDQDAEWQRWLTGARECVESDTRRKLLTQTLRLYLDDFPCSGDATGEEICLQVSPVQSVTSVKYYDEAGALQTLSGSAWGSDLVGDRGAIYPVFGYTWPTVRPRTPGAVVIEFVAGWTSAELIPTVLKQAIAMLAGHWWRYREAAGDERVSERPLGYADLVTRGRWM